MSTDYTRIRINKVANCLKMGALLSTLNNLFEDTPLGLSEGFDDESGSESVSRMRFMYAMNVH